MIRKDGNKALTVTYARDGQNHELKVTPVLNKKAGYVVLGITQSIDKVNIFQAVKLGCKETYDFSKLLVVSLYKMITGQMAVDLAGPVGMVTMVGDYAQSGVMYLFLFAGILSINLGIINLLPFPALDGFRIISLCVEGVRGKPIDRNKEGMMNFVGLVILLALMVVITYHDILRLIGG